jgi:hypothetical protein
VLGCKIPHELDALKWKAIGRRRHSFISQKATPFTVTAMRTSNPAQFHPVQISITCFSEIILILSFHLCLSPPSGLFLAEDIKQTQNSLTLS